MTAIKNHASSQKSEARLAWERARIEEAVAEINSGFSMDEVEVEAWLDNLDNGESLPIPELRPGPPVGR